MKITYLTAVFIFAASLVLLADAKGQRPAFMVRAQVQRSDNNTDLLMLRVQDMKDKSGICPYYVKTLQYLSGVKLLNIEVYQEFCVNGAFGKSEGDVFWTLPKELLSSKSTLGLLVNQEKIGALVYDGSLAGYRVELGSK